LIEAHIIPKGFGRLIRGEASNMKLTPDKVREANPQLGEYDPDILCETCDNILGLDDEYALDVWKRFEASHRNLGEDVFELAEVDCERFCKFILSILWRASISRRPSFTSVNLGPYEDLSRDILFGAKRLSDMPAFEVLVQRYLSTSMDPTKWYFHPVRQPFGDLDAYGFGLAGFRIVAKLDNRPFPEGFRPFVLNRSNVFRGFFVPLEQCSEFQSIAGIVRNNARRQAAFSQERKR